MLEQSDRTRRNVEQELADTNESLSDLTCQNQAICGAKLKCEQVRMMTIVKPWSEIQSQKPKDLG